jgi:hypothetical protein
MDKREKSLCNSVINVLSRNRNACTRMPRYRDTRKFSRATIHNGWNDAEEPSCGLAAHMKVVTTLFSKLKKARGVLTFPPKPPYDELKPHPTVCLVPAVMAPTSRRTVQLPTTVPTATGEDTGLPDVTKPLLLLRQLSVQPNDRKRSAFAVSDFSCSERVLAPVGADAYVIVCSFTCIQHQAPLG